MLDDALVDAADADVLWLVREGDRPVEPQASLRRVTLVSFRLIQEAREVLIELVSRRWSSPVAFANVVLQLREPLLEVPQHLADEGGCVDVRVTAGGNVATEIVDPCRLLTQLDQVLVVGKS